MSIEGKYTVEKDNFSLMITKEGPKIYGEYRRPKAEGVGKFECVKSPDSNTPNVYSGGFTDPWNRSGNIVLKFNATGFEGLFSKPGSESSFSHSWNGVKVSG